MKNHVIFLTLFSLISSQMHGMQREEGWCQRAIAFLMAGHPRLGEGSPAQVLSPDVRRHILELEYLEYQEEIDSKIKEWKTKSQEDRDQALLNATKTGKLGLVQILLEAGANVNTREYCGGHTLLHLATENGHTKIVKALLEAKAEVNAINLDDIIIPMHLAALNGHEAVTKLLLENKADIEMKNNAGFTPLHFAAARGHLAVVRTLLKAKADPNPRNLLLFETPLHLAARNGRLAVVEVLLAAFANVDARGWSFKLTPLYWANASCQTEIANLLRTYGATE